MSHDSSPSLDRKLIRLYGNGATAAGRSTSGRVISEPVIRGKKTLG